MFESVLNMPQFYIYKGSEYASCSKHVRVLSISYSQYKKVPFCQCCEYTFPEIEKSSVMSEF